MSPWVMKILIIGNVILMDNDDVSPRELFTTSVTMKPANKQNKHRLVKESLVIKNWVPTPFHMHFPGPFKFKIKIFQDSNLW